MKTFWDNVVKIFLSLLGICYLIALILLLYNSFTSLNRIDQRVRSRERQEYLDYQRDSLQVEKLKQELNDKE